MILFLVSKLGERGIMAGACCDDEIMPLLAFLCSLRSDGLDCTSNCWCESRNRNC